MFKNTWKHIRRSPYQAASAIMTMVLTFFVSGLLVIITAGSLVVLNYFEQKPQIIAFFNDTKTETDILALKDRLEKMERIESVKYVSKEAALEIYKEQFKKDPVLLEMVSADILPASLEISAQKLDYLPELANMLKNEPDVREIVFPEDVVNLLMTWTRIIRQIGLGLVGFLVIVSLFAVVTVISLKIALKKEEIDILQLIGASPGYIRLPFILEGVFYGLIGSLIGAGLNIGLLLWLAPAVQSVFKGVPLLPAPFLFYPAFALLLILSGAFLGCFASLVAINRYLR